mgnify:CR=1 FL=1
MDAPTAVPGPSPSGAARRADGNLCLRPGRLLAGRVRDYSGYEEQLAAPVQRREMPSSRVTLVVSFGDPVEVPRSRYGVPGDPCACLVSGPHDRVARTRIRGAQHGVLMRLRPFDAYSLLGVPMHLISNRFVDLETIFGRSSLRLTEQLAEARDWTRRFDILNTELAARIATGPAPDPAVEWAWRRLRATAGNTRISALAEHLGWSRRHLVRKFRQQVGLSPKTAALIFRFERAMALLDDRSRSLADVAAEAGYADQAHFSRAVHDLTGHAPGEFRTTPLMRALG